MTDQRPPNYYVTGGGVAVLLVIAIPLFREFYEPGYPVWNAFLALLLAGLAIGVFFLARFFRTHAGEIGEARFDTRNNRDTNG